VTTRNQNPLLFYKTKKNVSRSPNAAATAKQSDSGEDEKRARCETLQHFHPQNLILSQAPLAFSKVSCVLPLVGERPPGSQAQDLVAR